jgi:hypothetical protein
MFTTANRSAQSSAPSTAYVATGNALLGLHAVAVAVVAVIHQIHDA